MKVLLGKWFYAAGMHSMSIVLAAVNAWLFHLVAVDSTVLSYVANSQMLTAANLATGQRRDALA